MIRVTVYLASRENDQNSDGGWIDGCVKCIGLIVCPHFTRLFQISVKALGRASREICEEVRSFLPATASPLITNESGKIVKVSLFPSGKRETGGAAENESVADVSLSEMGGVVLKVSGIVMPCVSVWQAWRRWAYERSIERAERLERILSGFKKDEVADTYYRYIEYGEKFYDNDKHDFIGDEKKIDQMLAWFSFLCYQHRRKVISNVEFSEFAYQISMVVENQQVQTYCTDLYSNEMTHEKPFVELIRYGKDHCCMRMRDLYNEFCGRDDIWSKIKKRLGMGKEELTQPVREDAITSSKAFHKGGAKDSRNSRLPEFEQYLHRYYSEKSVASICWCARKASELLEKSLDEMTGGIDNYARACDGIAGLDITAKLKGNLKHAIDKYWKFCNGAPPRPMTRVVLLLCLILSGYMSFAALSVSDVKVFSGYPWREVGLRREGATPREMRDWIWNNVTQLVGLPDIVEDKSKEGSDADFSGLSPSAGKCTPLTEEEMGAIAETLIAGLKDGNVLCPMDDEGGKYAVTGVAAEYL